MECASLVACAHKKRCDFWTVAFTTDSLADINEHGIKNWGNDTHVMAL